MTDDGGYVNAYCDANDGEHISDYNGISRRDWLAGLAMQGMFASCEDDPKEGMKIITSIATLAYLTADAMIAEGRKASDGGN